jgi:regulator of protease activity HflC (stomatin/prohibitin superfamily)
MMRLMIDLKENERGVLLENGVAKRALVVGRNVAWSFSKLEAVIYDTGRLVIDMPGSYAELLKNDLIQISVGDRERVLVQKRGRPVAWLATGTWLIWNVDQLAGATTVAVQRIDVRDVTAEPLRDDVRALVPQTDYVEATVPEGNVALRMVDGKVDALLGAGRQAAWAVRRKVAYQLVEMRERVLAINGQEVMSKDKVTLRINASLTLRVVDAQRWVTVAQNADEVLYLTAQLVLREAVAARHLEELLAERDLLVAETLPILKARGAQLGVEVLGLGIKDLILPGEMKTLMNRVIEAQKAAEANVIFRREETNATRNLAQTAKVLAENPIVLRLKELEAYKELAEKVGTVNVVLGDGMLSKLELKT